ncbi:hypothetical protein L7H23_18480, partial [Sphingopyxis sp. BSN-002]|uniref:hypothetical protein n=1 Tax=Sphingopyxis sp. BSN-002 TaxID=2911495 RepID=UPI001EDC0F27
FDRLLTIEMCTPAKAGAHDFTSGLGPGFRRGSHGKRPLATPFSTVSANQDVVAAIDRLQTMEDLS